MEIAADIPGANGIKLTITHILDWKIILLVSKWGHNGMKSSMRCLHYWCKVE